MEEWNNRVGHCNSDDCNDGTSDYNSHYSTDTREFKSTINFIVIVKTQAEAKAEAKSEIQQYTDYQCIQSIHTQQQQQQQHINNTSKGKNTL